MIVFSYEQSPDLILYSIFLSRDERENGKQRRIEQFLMNHLAAICLLDCAATVMQPFQGSLAIEKSAIGGDVTPARSKNWESFGIIVQHCTEKN